MHTRIRPTRPEGRNGCATEARERLFDHPLYRALLRLSLPTAEVRAVILQNELHGAFGHREESYPTRNGRASKTACAMIDFISTRQTHCALL